MCETEMKGKETEKEGWTEREFSTSAMYIVLQSSKRMSQLAMESQKS